MTYAVAGARQKKTVPLGPFFVLKHLCLRADVSDGVHGTLVHGVEHVGECLLHLLKLLHRVFQLFHHHLTAVLVIFLAHRPFRARSRGPAHSACGNRACGAANTAERSNILPTGANHGQCAADKSFTKALKHF